GARADPAGWATGRPAASVATSLAYCPVRRPDGPQSSARPSSRPISSATSWNRSRTRRLTVGTVVSLACAAAGTGTARAPVAVIDVAGFVADLKSQAID